jgi:hypothetical protein
MAQQTEFQKNRDGTEYGPRWDKCSCSFVPAATLDQTLIDSHGIHTVARTGVGVYTMELPQTPSEIQVFVGLEGNVAHRPVRWERSGTTLTVRIFNDTPAAADIGTMCHVFVRLRDSY